MWFRVKLIDLSCPSCFLSTLIESLVMIIGQETTRPSLKANPSDSIKTDEFPFPLFPGFFFCPILLCVPFCFFWLLDAVALSLLSFDTCVSSDAKKRLARLKFAAPMTLITLSLPHHYQHIIRLHLQANGDRMLTLSTIHRPTIHSLPFENVAQLNY